MKRLDSYSAHSLCRQSRHQLQCPTAWRGRPLFQRSARPADVRSAMVSLASILASRSYAGIDGDESITSAFQDRQTIEVACLNS
jgi:hypothetical protein